jgi:hypothetical protein
MLTSPAPPPRAGHATTCGRANAGAPHTVTMPVRSCHAHAARLAGPFRFMGWVVAARPWAKWPTQHCAPVFHFLFSFKNSRNHCKLLKYLENEIQLQKMQNKLWMNPQE